MVQVVVGDKVPEHWLALGPYVVPEEQIVRFLSLIVEEGIVVVALEALDHITRVALPVVQLAVCRHRVDKM